MELTIATLTIVIITLTSQLQSGDATSCDSALGLESMEIPDSQMTSTLDLSNPSGARLNSENTAWCFNYSEVRSSGKPAELIIDLGTTQLVSGLVSQGPPARLHPPSYIRYIGIHLLLSRDNQNWKDCCNEDGTQTTFYADDKTGELDATRVHSFGRLEAARFVKIKVSTDLRWIGHDEKCFRFELLGCRSDSSAESFLKTRAEAPGYITVQWSPPTVSIPGNNNFTLNGHFFLLNLTHKEVAQSTGELVVKSQVLNTSDTSMAVPSPLWGSQYLTELTCWHQHVPLKCGESHLTAKPEISVTCQAHSSFCGEDEKIQFISPTFISAALLSTNSVMLKWRYSTRGWRSPERLVTLQDEDNNHILNREVGLEEREIILPNLKRLHSYRLSFFPSGEDVPSDVGEIKQTLIILNITEDDTWGAFVSEVGLQASVDWEGRIRVEWRKGRAEGVGSDLGPVYRMADGYRLTLDTSEDTVFQTTQNLASNVTSSNLTGISMDKIYTVSLKCLFYGEEYDCGTRYLSTKPPNLLLGNMVYKQLGVAKSWYESLLDCESGGGTLASLGQPSVEQAVSESLDISDFWTGGNMCPDSPVPPHSMWTDGSYNHHTNFAIDSGLDGVQCCIKSGLSGWRGEVCSSLLHGICQQTVLDPILPPEQLIADAGKGGLAVRWKRSLDGWSPDVWNVAYCQIRNLDSQMEREMEPCKNESLASKAVGVILSRVAEYAEYNITLTAVNNFFNTKKSATIVTRTLPTKELKWKVDMEGTLVVEWLEEISRFRESWDTLLRWNLTGNSSGIPAAGSVWGTANRTEVTGLVLGKSYTIQLYLMNKSTELENSDLSEVNKTIPSNWIKNISFSFTAYPNCTENTLQHNLLCFKLINNLTYYEARDECERMGYSIWSPDLGSEDKDLEAKLSQASQISQHPTFWVGNFSQDEEACSVWTSSDFLSGDDTIECVDQHSAVCQLDLTPQLVFTDPSKSLRVEPGPESISLTWDESERGWRSVYSLIVQPLEVQNRSSRELNPLKNLTFLSPPAVRVNLEPDTPYTVTLTTEIGTIHREIHLGEVRTRFNQSVSPKQLIGLNVMNSRMMIGELVIYSMVMLMLSITILIYLLSQTIGIYTDNVAQISFCISLLSAYIILALSRDVLPCLAVTAGLQVTFLTAQTFLCLETFIILHKLVDSCAMSWIEKPVAVVLLGLLIPSIYCGIAIPLLHQHMAPANQNTICWLNLSSWYSIVFWIPIITLFLISTINIVLTLTQGKKIEPRPNSASAYSRARTLRKTRYMVLLQTILLTLIWVTGVIGSHYQSNISMIALLILSVLLGSSTLCLRCVLDTQVLERVKRGYLHCDGAGDVYSQGPQQLASRKTTLNSPKSILKKPSTVGDTAAEMRRQQQRPAANGDADNSGQRQQLPPDIIVGNGKMKTMPRSSGASGKISGHGREVSTTGRRRGAVGGGASVAPSEQLPRPQEERDSHNVGEAGGGTTSHFTSMPDTTIYGVDAVYGTDAIYGGSDVYGGSDTAYGVHYQAVYSHLQQGTLRPGPHQHTHVPLSTFKARPANPANQSALECTPCSCGPEFPTPVPHSISPLYTSTSSDSTSGSSSTHSTSTASPPASGHGVSSRPSTAPAEGKSVNLHPWTSLPHTPDTEEPGLPLH